MSHIYVSTHIISDNNKIWFVATYECETWSLVLKQEQVKNNKKGKRTSSVTFSHVLATTVAEEKQ